MAWPHVLARTVELEDSNSDSVALRDSGLQRPHSLLQMERATTDYNDLYNLCVDLHLRNRTAATELAASTRANDELRGTVQEMDAHRLELEDAGDAWREVFQEKSAELSDIQVKLNLSVVVAAQQVEEHDMAVKDLIISHESAVQQLECQIAKLAAEKDALVRENRVVQFTRAGLRDENHKLRAQVTELRAELNATAEDIAVLSQKRGVKRKRS